MLSQNAIPSRKQLGGTLPYVFTEHGVLMLANVLKSEEAIKASIRIIEIFVKLRQAILDTTTMNVKIEHIRRRQDDQDKNMELVLTYIDELMEKQENPPPRKQIGYKRTDS
jgi:hypothetical protein